MVDALWVDKKPKLYIPIPASGSCKNRAATIRTTVITTEGHRIMNRQCGDSFYMAVPIFQCWILPVEHGYRAGGDAPVS